MKNNTDIPEEVFNKIMLYNSHPLADLFKKELMKEFHTPFLLKEIIFNKIIKENFLHLVR